MPIVYESLEISDQREAPRSFANRSTARIGCTLRPNNENVALDAVRDKLGELVVSIKETKKKIWKEKLVATVWSMKGYSDVVMDWVFQRLCINKDLAEAFYLKKPSLCKMWLDNFFASKRDSSP